MSRIFGRKSQRLFSTACAVRDAQNINYLVAFAARKDERKKICEEEKTSITVSLLSATAYFFIDAT